VNPFLSLVGSSHHYPRRLPLTRPAGTLRRSCCRLRSAKSVVWVSRRSSSRRSSSLARWNRPRDRGGASLPKFVSSLVVHAIQVSVRRVRMEDKDYTQRETTPIQAPLHNELPSPAP
jgi:hypothetical protein